MAPRRAPFTKELNRASVHSPPLRVRATFVRRLAGDFWNRAMSKGFTQKEEKATPLLRLPFQKLWKISSCGRGFGLFNHQPAGKHLG